MVEDFFGIGFIYECIPEKRGADKQGDGDKGADEDDEFVEGDVCGGRVEAEYGEDWGDYEKEEGDAE